MWGPAGEKWDVSFLLLKGHSNKKVFEITPLNHRKGPKYANPSLIFKFAQRIATMF
jgi:hypothetical protein